MLEYPDVSRYTPDVDLSPYPGVVARSGMSDGTDANNPLDMRDPSYATYKQRAVDQGKLFSAYHWLNHGKGRACAAWCFSIVGAGVPVMIDGEDVPGNSGYNGPLVVQDFLDFATELRTLGGICWGSYVAKWYWQGHMGSPNLIPLQDAGMALISSNYTTYSDTGPGWQPYGGVTPSAWQFASQPHDRNAFQGDAAALAKLWQLGTGPIPAPPGPSYEILKVDGIWGTRTTSRLQQFAGTPVDGQLSPGAGQSSWTAWAQSRLNAHGFRDESGRLLVVDGDGLSFLPQDGHHTHSIAALERAMGRGVDGYLSYPSPTVAVMQDRLNHNQLF